MFVQWNSTLPCPCQVVGAEVSWFESSPHPFFFHQSKNNIQINMLAVGPLGFIQDHFLSRYCNGTTMESDCPRGLVFPLRSFAFS
jgi:hypothetical protein